MVTIKLHLLTYIVIITVITSWLISTGQTLIISIFLGTMGGVIVLLADNLFQFIAIAGNRRKKDVEAINKNIDYLEGEIKKLKE